MQPDFMLNCADLGGQMKEDLEVPPSSYAVVADGGSVHGSALWRSITTDYWLKKLSQVVVDFPDVESAELFLIEERERRERFLCRAYFRLFFQEYADELVAACCFVYDPRTSELLEVGVTATARAGARASRVNFTIPGSVDDLPLANVAEVLRRMQAKLRISEAHAKGKRSFWNESFMLFAKRAAALFCITPR